MDETLLIRVPKRHLLDMDIKQDLVDAGVKVSHHFVGDAYAKMTEIPTGCKLTQHRHKFGHDSALLLGSVRVTMRGHTTIHFAPDLIHIPAHESHEFEAVTPSLVSCLWANPDGLTDPDKFDHQVIEQ